MSDGKDAVGSGEMVVAILKKNDDTKIVIENKRKRSGGRIWSILKSIIGLSVI